MDKEMEALIARRNMSPEEVSASATQKYIDQIKTLISQAVSDYSQLFDAKKNTKAANAEIKGNEVLNTIDSSFSPFNEDGTPNLSMGFGGTMSKALQAKYIKATEQLTKNPKNAQRYNNTTTDGRGSRIDMGEYYDINTRDDILSLIDGWANKSKGKREYTDKMVGLALREGMDKPQRIAIPNLQEIDTLRQLANNVAPLDTKLGHSAWSIANKFGGVLDDLNVTPNNKTKVQNPGNIGKIVDKFDIDPNVQMDVLQANQVYRPQGYNSMGGRFIYQGSDLDAPIAYPKEGEDFSHLLQFFRDNNPKLRGERKLNPDTMVQFLQANGISKAEILKRAKK